MKMKRNSVSPSVRVNHTKTGCGIINFVSAVLVAAVSLSASVAYAEESAPSNPSSTVTVRGTASVSLEWKAAIIKVAVNRRADEAQAAFASLRSDLARMAKVIEKMGIENRNVKTEGLVLSLDERDVQRNGSWERVVMGHQASAVLSVKVPADDSVGEVIDALTSAGANRVLGVSFETEDPSAARAKALGDAVSDARSRAEAMADAAGMVLGAPIEIAEQTGWDGPVPAMENMRAMAADNVSTPVYSGEASISVNVHSVWRLKKKQDAGARP